MLNLCYTVPDSARYGVPLFIEKGVFSLVLMCVPIVLLEVREKWGTRWLLYLLITPVVEQKTLPVAVVRGG